jgi:hypothetical protein
MESYDKNWMEACGVLKEDKFNDDVDIKKGMICTMGDKESCLLRIRTIYESNSVSLWPFEICKVNGYPPERKLLTALDEYLKSKYCLNDHKSQKQHINACKQILIEIINEFERSSCVKSLKVEVESALELIEYYRKHLNWKQGYPRGECFFICHIGRAILILENGSSI